MFICIVLYKHIYQIQIGSVTSKGLAPGILLMLWLQCDSVTQSRISPANLIHRFNLSIVIKVQQKIKSHHACMQPAPPNTQGNRCRSKQSHQNTSKHTFSQRRNKLHNGMWSIDFKANLLTWRTVSELGMGNKMKCLRMHWHATTWRQII